MKILLAVALIAVCAANPVWGQSDTSIATYETWISNSDRVNTKGVPLTDATSILIQERSNTHKNGGDGSDFYLTTPSRRAEIPGMLKRGGGLAPDIAKAIVHGNEPHLRVRVYRTQSGAVAMSVAMANAVAPPQVQSAPEGPAPQSASSNTDRTVVLQVLVKEIERNVGEKIKLLGTRVAFDGPWARVDTAVATASGRDPIRNDTDHYFYLDLTALAKKTESGWKILKHVVAGDISAEIEIPEAYPEVPRSLFSRQY